MMQELGKKRFILVSEFHEVNIFHFYKKEILSMFTSITESFFNLTLMPCSLLLGH